MIDYDLADILQPFLDMNADNYEQRKVGLWQDDSQTMLVSTARVTDGQHPYETAVEHPAYHDGQMIIVEAYDSLAAARTGHAKWTRTVQKDTLPPVLTDCCNSLLARLARDDGNAVSYRRTSRPARRRSSTRRSTAGTA